MRLAWDLLRAEGPRGFGARLADRFDELRRRGVERTVSPEALTRAGTPVPVLDVLATPLAPRWGGIPTQLRARLMEEARLRPTALLSPEEGQWTLRTSHGGLRQRARLGPWQPVTDPAESPRAAIGPILEAVRLVGARLVNVEGVSGWPPGSLLGLAIAKGEPKVVISLHDFALFCPRPNLVEEPSFRFCDYSRDANRCRTCLSASWSLPRGFVEAWRASGEELLSSADAVVYPSEFLRRQHATLFPGARPRQERVIAPPAPGEGGVALSRPARKTERDGPLHVAFVGAYRPHKGALVFEELLRRFQANRARPMRWSILGSGDPALLVRARRLGGYVLGHYRAGGLTRLLCQERVDIALLLSVWPETFGLTLSECRAAGVPVLAFAHGAIGDRITAEGGGALVPPEEGADGVAELLQRILAREVVIPPFRGGEAGPSASHAASERISLYDALLGEAN